MENSAPLVRARRPLKCVFFLEKWPWGAGLDFWWENIVSKLCQYKVLLFQKKFCCVFPNCLSFVLGLASHSRRWTPRETSSRPKFSPFCTFKIGHNYLGHKHLLTFSKYSRQKKSQTEIDSYLSANRHTKIILFFDHFSNFEMREILKIRRNKLPKGDFNNIFSRYLS